MSLPSRMSNRERLLGVFQSKAPVAVPFAPDLSYYYGVNRKVDDNWSAAEATERFIAFHLEHRCIPYYQYVAYQPFRLATDGVKIESHKAGPRSICRYELGGKSISSVFEFSEISHSSAQRDLESIAVIRIESERMLELGTWRNHGCGLVRLCWA